MRRRDALKALGALAGAASTARLLSACGGDDNAERGISTLVFVMMENRSFDHFLGSRSLIEGRPLNGLVEGMSNPARSGQDIEIWLADSAAMCVPDPAHSWTASRSQFDGGANDGFVIEQQRRYGDGAIQPMSYLVREQQPVTYALADAYTVCDNWFASVMGPTLPNRMFWHAGTSNGAMDNDTVVGGAFKGIPSIYHRLDDRNVDWAYYYGDIPVLSFLDNIDLAGRVRRFTADFYDDAEAGRLPPVVYIDPNFGVNDDHPPHHPLMGQQFLSSIYTALATSPQWENCMMVVTYDEHGGFFDHVAPPKTTDDRAADGFDQLGFRVPALVVGPYAKQAYVSSVQHDHTSALKHIENVFGLDPLTARSTAARDLADCIDLERLEAGRPAAPIELPAVEIDQLSLPAICTGSSLRSFDHDLHYWAESANLGKLDLRDQSADYAHAIAAYLDKHGLGRIKP